MLAGIAGIAAIYYIVRVRMQQKLPIGTLVGLLMTGIAAVGLSTFMLFWDLGPF